MRAIGNNAAKAAFLNSPPRVTPQTERLADPPGRRFSADNWNMTRLAFLAKLSLLVAGGFVVTATTGFRWTMLPATCIGMALAYLVLRNQGIRRIDSSMVGALAANYVFFFWVHAWVVKFETALG